MLTSIMAWAKMCYCKGTDSYIGNGESAFVTVSWAAEGGCCGNGSGMALVDYTYCYGATCSTTSYYITVHQAQVAADCSGINPV